MSESGLILWVAAALGGLAILMRLIRAYGDEVLEFAKWLVHFMEQIRNLRIR